MIGSRVTTRSIADSAMANLQRSLANTARLQDQLTSGRRIQRPSQDPTGTSNAMQVRADKRSVEQYARNADDGLGWLGQADQALQGASALLRSAYEKTIQGHSAAAGPQARAALAAEIGEIKRGLLEIANTTYLDRPVFGGTTGGKTAFAPDGTYTGGPGAVERRLSDVTIIKVNTDGAAVFGSGAGSVFALLDKVASDLVSSPGNLDADIGAIQDAATRITGGLTDVGARYNRVNDMLQRAGDQTLSLQSKLATIESIDLPKTIMDLQMQQIAHQAALGAVGKVIQPTLMDFLR